MENTQCAIPPSVRLFFPQAKATKLPNSITKQIKLDQIAILVRDITTAIDQAGALYGWGPWYVAEFKGEAKYYGEEEPFHLKMAFCMVGEFEVELLQLLAGRTPHLDQMEHFGEGLFHARLKTAHIDEQIAALAPLGVYPSWEYYAGGSFLVNAYTNSESVCGLRTELIRTDQEIIDAFKLING